MSEATDWELLARYLAGECSKEERNRVEAWAELHSDRRDLLRLLSVIWDYPETEVQGRDVQDMWRAVAEKAGIDRRPIKSRVSIPRELRTRRVLAYAAILLALLAIPYFVWRHSRSVSSSEITLTIHTVLVSNGRQENLELPDGTKVTLDAGSSFQYPDEFSGQTREVWLEGEGFFEVASDRRRPFVIHVQGALIRVLGTRFNVRAWQGSDEVEVVVSRGRVSLSPERDPPGSEVVVTEGQISTMRGGQVPSPPQPVDVESHLLWLDREADFRDVTLQEILYLLERWYDVRFVLKDRSVIVDRLTVYIDNRPIDEILELIATLTDQGVERKGNLVYLHPNRIN